MGRLAHLTPCSCPLAAVKLHDLNVNMGINYDE